MKTRSHTVLVGAPEETTPTEGNLAIRKKTNHIRLGSENWPVKDNTTNTKKKAQSYVLQHIIHNGKDWKQSACPTSEDRLNELWHVYTSNTIQS